MRNFQRPPSRFKQKGFILNPFVFGGSQPDPTNPELTEDPWFSLVTLLIQGTSDIVDVKGHSISFEGSDIAIGTTYVPSGAIESSAATIGSKMRVQGNPGDFTPGTGPFTVEMFVTADPGGPGINEYYNALWSTSDNGSGYSGMNVEYSTIRNVYWYNQDPNIFDLTPIGLNVVPYPTDGVERHIAMSGDGMGNYFLAVDGKIVRRNTSANVIGCNSSNIMTFFNYMSDAETLFGFKGAIRGIRFTKQCRYKGYVGKKYFIPLLPYHETGPADPYLAYVTSVMNGLDDATDSVGNITEFIGASMYHDAATDRIIMSQAGGPDSFRIHGDGIGGGIANAFTPGTDGLGAFCLEAYLSLDPSTPAYAYILDTTQGNGSGLGGMAFEWSPVRGILVFSNEGASFGLEYPDGASLLDNVERHVFVARDTIGNYALGIDGVVVATVAGGQSNLTNTSEYLCIGNYGAGTEPAESAKGTVRGVRYTNGQPRYPLWLGATYAVPALPMAAPIISD